MGMKKLGHRKVFMKKIEALKSKDNNAWDSQSNASGKSNETYSSMSTASSQSSGSRETVANIKCSFNGELKVIRMKKEKTLDALKKAIKKEYGKRMDIKVVDSDGDHVSVRKDSEL